MSALHFVDDSARPRVVFGEGTVAEVPAEISRLAARQVLLISTRSSSHTAETLTALLEGKVAASIDDVAMHVPQDTVDRALATLGSTSIDLLLCVGGGSAVGLAKAVASQTGLPIMAVPTTYAGSEMTRIWGRTTGGEKVTGRDSRVLPHTVIYDPRLTLGLPVGLSVTSGLNAVAHCVESLYAPDATAGTVAAASDGLAELVQWLPRVVQEPTNLQARSHVLRGAFLAGRSLDATQMGLHHMLCHALGGVAGLPHSPCHAALLPHVISWNEAAAGSSLDPAREALRRDDGYPTSVAAGMWQLNERLGAPLGLEVVGLDLTQVPAVADAVAVDRVKHPRRATPADLVEILSAAYAGRCPQ